MDAELYDELHRVEQTHWWFRARRHIVWSLVQRHVADASNRRLRICELGCGTGGNLVEFAAEHDVVGVECSPQGLDYARKSLGNRVRFGRLPFEIDLPANSYDVVLMTDVLEHIEDDAASAQVALQLLRPGGVVVATVPAYQWLFSPRDVHHHHFRRYAKQQFRELWKSDNAHVELLSHYNTTLFPAAAFTRLASKFVPARERMADLRIPPSTVNKQLTRVMQCEANLIGRVPMPFGLSLVTVVRKHAASHAKTWLAAA